MKQFCLWFSSFKLHSYYIITNLSTDTDIHRSSEVLYVSQSNWGLHRKKNILNADKYTYHVNLIILNVDIILHVCVCVCKGGGRRQKYTNIKYIQDGSICNY